MKNLLLLCLGFALFSCIDDNPNKEIDSVITNREIERSAPIRTIEDSLHKVYVPIYSSIYNGSKNEKVLLTATLSIRNTSERDSIFLSRVAYFDTEGNLVRNYVKQPIYLKPLESLEYVIDQNDDTGGSGANFKVDWYGDKSLRPIMQGVMIGGLASRTFSFTTDGMEVD
ncbi:DUF3124 domain-containing protein [Dokdonia sinensis]|uniref:DUF3124 domain-containing protein n=1 Tax=Dokdonia sinensis TaxID=2479847 RepID=A0A3M0GHJ2_9FLAO|nr:DUF3124 domain-containing protein [Dokdonia sinensis]RMB64144.1 DUF3124 domain-containing protein [Dokdonia sinensis]